MDDQVKQSQATSMRFTKFANLTFSLVFIVSSYNVVSNRYFLNPLRAYDCLIPTNTFYHIDTEFWTV